jgi:hypothetical protein
MTTSGQPYSDGRDVRGAESEGRETPARWNVRESQQVLEWQAEAVVKTQRANVLRILEAICGSAAPADVASVIQASTDPEQLSRWFDAALKVKSYDEFRSALSSSVRND